MLSAQSYLTLMPASDNVKRCDCCHHKFSAETFAGGCVEQLNSGGAQRGQVKKFIKVLRTN